MKKILRSFGIIVIMLSLITISLPTMANPFQDDPPIWTPPPPPPPPGK